MKKIFVLMISLMLTTAATAGKHDGKNYTVKDFKTMIDKSDKLGQRSEIPCPCIWNKNRGRGDDFTVSDEVNTWKCTKWNDAGTCDTIGTVKGQ